MLVQRRQRGGAEHDLVPAGNRVPGQDRRRDGRVRVAEQHGNGLPVQVGGGVGDPGPRRDAGGGAQFAVDLLPGHRRRPLVRGQGVGPVPAVQRRTGDERRQARAERQRGHHDDHREDGGGQRRAGGHGPAAPACARVERELEPRDRRRGQPGSDGQPARRRTPRRDRRGRGPARTASPPDGRACRQDDRDRAENAGQQQEPAAEDGPVERHPRRRIDRPHRPDRRDGGEGHRHGHREQRARRHRPEQAEQAVGGDHGEAGPSARSTIRSASPARTCRAMACAPTSSVTASAMTANAASAIQSGSMLLCTCASSSAATLNQAAPPAPSLASASRSTAGTLPAPPSSLSPYQAMPLLSPPRAASSSAPA